MARKLLGRKKQGHPQEEGEQDEGTADPTPSCQMDPENERKTATERERERVCVCVCELLLAALYSDDGWARSPQLTCYSRSSPPLGEHLGLRTHVSTTLRTVHSLNKELP